MVVIIKKWKQFESTWNKWNVQEIILYLQYKTKTLNVNSSDDGNKSNDDDENKENKEDEENDIDWLKVEQVMKEEKFKGKYLNSIDKSDLKSFGIINFAKKNQVYKIITNLCENNPIEKDDGQEGGSVTCEEGQIVTNNNCITTAIFSIDSRYLCPLTNELMKDPVIAFDGKCYEKEAIIDYIRKNKQSPITKEKIDDVEWAISLLHSSKSLKDEINEKFCD